MYRTKLTAFAALLTLANVAHSENWGHWRGPTGNGTADAQPPTVWSDTENVKWKVAIAGRSSGSPVVWEQQVFAVTSVPVPGAANKLSFKLLCLDRQTGQILWERTAVEAVPHQETHATNSFDLWSVRSGWRISCAATATEGLRGRRHVTRRPDGNLHEPASTRPRRTREARVDGAARLS